MAFWNGFVLGHARGEVVPRRFCGSANGDGHLFWECTHPPLVHTRENPELHRLMHVDKSARPRCLLWDGWLPALGCLAGGPTWAESAGGIGLNRLESAFGSNSDAVCGEWVPGDQFFGVSEQLDVWTDGSYVHDDLSGIGGGGSGVYAHRSGSRWFDRRWGHLDLLPVEGALGC